MAAAALCLTIQPLESAAPSRLFASTLGGSEWDTVRAVTTDSSQNIYLVGETYSSDFPGSSSSHFTGDAFVVKLDPSGQHILFTVILAGSGYDSARGVAVDPSGNVYVTGVTSSSDFPITSGSFQRTSPSPGLNDAFVAKITTSGTIVYCTYLGGSSADTGYAIAVDASGAAYVAGSTDSGNFPLSGAPQSRTGGSTDCFVSKLNPAGSALLYSTYLGGENIDVCRSIAVDGAGAAFVTGTTRSAGFPAISAIQNFLNGPSDAFLTKLSPAGDRFVFSTYLGGEGLEDGNAVRVDASGNAYVGGDTSSVSFPVTSGALQSHINGAYDGFVCGVSSNGGSIQFATYFGGSAIDSINDLFIAQNGRIVVAGHTASSDLPLANPLQSAFGGTFDAFVAVLGPNAGELFFATYLGGGGDDRAYGVAPLGSGQLVFAGQMLAGSVASVQQLYSTTPAGQYDGFVLSIAYEQPLRFVPLSPCRVADTRVGSGAFGGPSMSGGSSRNFSITSSSCGVPSSAQAYSLNITAVPHGTLGYLSIWPTGQQQPSVSLLNSDGRVKANATIVPAGSGGAVSFFVTDTTDVVIDLNGYFVPASTPAALPFYPLTPCRVADTRLSPGPLGGPSILGSTTRTLSVLSAAACNIPSTAQAYSLNFTAIPPSMLAYVTIWPSGQALPLVSTLNDPTGTVVASAAIMPAGNSGAISIYSSNVTDLATDINGYFAPAGQGALSFYTVTPCRVFDSRTQPGAQPINGTVTVNLTGGVCGVPTAAQAFVLNITVLPAGPLGYLSLWPQGQAQPLVSTLNAPDGVVTSNMAIVPTMNGSISLYTTSGTQVILDISGYFAP